MRKLTIIILVFSLLWLPTASWYLARGIAHQHAIAEALRVFRNPDATAHQVAAKQKALLAGHYPGLVLLFLIQELNQEEHRYSDMRLCRGFSKLLIRRQEHSAADAASRLLDATFMWPHVRHIPDLVIELRKPVILEPSRRKRREELVKALRELCPKREIDFTSRQRELILKGIGACLSQPELKPQAKAMVQQLKAAVAATPKDAALPQTPERWKALRLVARALKAMPDLDSDTVDAVDALQAKIDKSGPQASFIVDGVNGKILRSTLHHLQDRETKWQQKRAFTAGTLRFQPTSMEELQRYVARVGQSGLLTPWQRTLQQPFAQAQPARPLVAAKADLAAWQRAADAEAAEIESLCQALEALESGQRKLVDITRQAALFCLTGWVPRDGLRGAAEDTPLSRFQDFLWGEREWLPDDLKQPTSVVKQVCNAARIRAKTAHGLRASIAAKAEASPTKPLSPAEAAYLNKQAADWSELEKLPQILAEIVEGESAPLHLITTVHRRYICLKARELQDRYRRGRKRVAETMLIFVRKVVELAAGHFARRTKSEETGNISTIRALWKQRDEQMLTDDLARLLRSPFPEVRKPARQALLAVGRPAVAPLERLVEQRQINQLMAVETADLSKEDHTKLLERELRTSRTEAGRALAELGANLVAQLKAKGIPPEEDADVLRIRRALHGALNDPRSGLDQLLDTAPEFRQHLRQLELLTTERKPTSTDAKP